jgi:2-oxoglutarate ferredoxin oxidoreductase subunit gamma
MGELIMKTTEIRFSGFGGQGIVRCGLITGKALALFDNKHSTMTQSFGPEARGSACSSQLVVSKERVLYPYITNPEILVSMSQEAYDKYEPELRNNGTLIIDTDLVKPKPPRKTITMYSIPSTRFAEELGNRIFGNLVMLGFFTAITEVVSAEAMKKALPGLVPDRFLDLNIKAFDKGYDYGLEILKKSKAATAKKAAKPKTETKTQK